MSNQALAPRRGLRTTLRSRNDRSSGRFPVRAAPKLRLAIGPELPGVGSWEWIGSDLGAELAGRFEVTTFREEPPACDVALFVKWLPPLDLLTEIRGRCRVVYCPVDVYGSAPEIDADWRRLRCCRQVIVHCPDLAKYFRGYADVACLDHHLKFIAPLREQFISQGPILWTGVWSNLQPLVEWVNRHKLPEELWVLTNLEGRRAAASEFGFEGTNTMRVEEWSPARHREWLTRARAAIDIKADDFRARHKPAAKALDVLASGVPLAMNTDSSSTRYVRSLGFEIADAEDTDRWLSREYWNKTRQFAVNLRTMLTRAAICDRLAAILNTVCEQEAVP